MKPRKRGFAHHPIITVVNGVGMLESGELVRNLPVFAFTALEPYLWLTYEDVDVARSMIRHFGEYPWFCLGGTNSVDPDPSVAEVINRKGQLTSFGFDTKAVAAPGRRKTGRHILLNPSRMFGDRVGTRELMKVHDVVPATHPALMRFMCDVREWCEEQDLPMGKTLASIGGQLLRDKRFWPDARGRVPRATNEKIRPYLPAVHNELHAELHEPHETVIALDQRRAYHTIAQEIPTPDPTTLYARGYFCDPTLDRIWTKPGRPTYERIVQQPGILAVCGVSRPTRAGEPRLPALNFTGQKTIYLWTNELELAKSQGFMVEGLVAAWTSDKADTGLPRYGKWALAEIDRSDEYRRQWLKPTLHSTYGMLGARPRTMHFVEYSGTGDDVVTWYYRGHAIKLHRKILEDFLPAFANTAMLGVLQAEVRRRTFTAAMEVIDAGGKVLHTHADGLHVDIAQLPMLSSIVDAGRWTVDTLTDLEYMDKVSYVSREKSCLPGRTRSQREKLALVMAQKRKVRKWAGTYVRV